LNYCELGYLHNPSWEYRDLDPKLFMALVEYIVEAPGGQVVRVGHPQMTPFSKRRDIFDLAMLEDRLMLHAFAFSRARFMAGSMTGISDLGSAIDTPTAITNCVDSL
jgi:putative glycosyltransferase (TIGR04372 family)